MNLLRALIAISFFAVGVYLTIEVIVDTYNTIYLLGSLGLFLLAYLTWPSKKRGQRDDGHWCFDILELFVELPIEIFLWLFRLLGRFIKSGGDGGLDIDF